MFNEDYDLASHTAIKKVKFLKKDKLGYFISSMLAGFFVGLGVMLIYTIAGVMGDSPSIKVIQGISFTMPLCLVVFAGGELFTGNNFTMTAGVMKKCIKASDGIMLWVVCYLGNFAGAVAGATLFTGTGLAYGQTLAMMNTAIIYKTSPDAMLLFIRGIMCNLVVASAIWCTYRVKSDSGKLIMIFWCMYAFVITGFEHCIANMTLFTIGLLAPTAGELSINAMANNMVFVTLGNIVGGVIIALAYYAISRKQES